MPIKRKDGSVYKLSGPNPLFNDQEIWAKESIYIHNHSNLGSKSVAEVATPEPVMVIEQTQEVQEMPIQMPEPPLPPMAAGVVKEVVVKEPSIQEKKDTERDEVMFCLPAFIEEKRDPLYNDIVRRVGYRNPFRFLARVVKLGDVEFVIWTTDSRITTDSIVYHPDMRRWWKTVEAIRHEKGYFVRHIISDVTPDFTSV